MTSPTRGVATPGAPLFFSLLAWFCAVALVATPSGAISLRQRAVLAAADEGSEGAHDPQTGSSEVEDMFALEMDDIHAAAAREARRIADLRTEKNDDYEVVHEVVHPETGVKAVTALRLRASVAPRQQKVPTRAGSRLLARRVGKGKQLGGRKWALEQRKQKNGEGKTAKEVGPQTPEEVAEALTLVGSDQPAKVLFTPTAAGAPVAKYSAAERLRLWKLKQAKETPALKKQVAAVRALGLGKEYEDESIGRLVVQKGDLWRHAAGQEPQVVRTSTRHSAPRRGSRSTAAEAEAAVDAVVRAIKNAGHAPAQPLMVGGHDGLSAFSRETNPAAGPGAPTAGLARPVAHRHGAAARPLAPTQRVAGFSVSGSPREAAAGERKPPAQGAHVSGIGATLRAPFPTGVRAPERPAVAAALEHAVAPELDPEVALVGAAASPGREAGGQERLEQQKASPTSQKRLSPMGVWEHEPLQFELEF